jgi:hypothetical protein
MCIGGCASFLGAKNNVMIGMNIIINLQVYVLVENLASKTLISGSAMT